MLRTDSSVYEGEQTNLVFFKKQIIKQMFLKLQNQGRGGFIKS